MRGNVFIIGLGLIGGSLALSIKKDHPSANIIGYDISVEELKKAKMLKVIDEIAESFDSAAEKADLILLATPVMETEKYIEQLAALTLKESVLITDAGSTKHQIMLKAQILRDKGYIFIGGHPMAGSHKSGITAAKDRLFENAYYILTPYSDEEEKYVELLTSWLQGSHATFIKLQSNAHDEMVGVLSHFPHVIASSLVHQAFNLEEKYPSLMRLAAGGFRDITRIASSSPKMWTDITMRNKEVLTNFLTAWIADMEQIKETIQKEDQVSIFQFFDDAKTKRDMLPVKSKGALPSFYDLFVDVPDYPGVISEITGYLAKENISITNIKILETREDIFGVLRISFQNDSDRKRAEACITKETNYEWSE